MIRNILFDMGNVLIRFDRDYFITRLGITGPDQALLMQEVFQSVEWVRLDHGTLREPEALERICSRLPRHLHEAADKLVSFWDRPILPVDGMEELVRELKGKGYGLYLLSNASLRQHDYWPRVPGWECFDGKVISADEKVMKPDTAYYRIALERFGLRPEECFFVDDSPPNVEGAMCCGIDGAVFHGDAKKLRRQLRAAGVDVTE
jgi:putative hydrolase of the HAD superfamily